MKTAANGLGEYRHMAINGNQYGSEMRNTSGGENAEEAAYRRKSESENNGAKA